MVKYFKSINHPHIILRDIPRVIMILFILFNILAMYLYSGGNYLDPTAPGYSLTKNFFSDLGRLTSFSELSNWKSFLLFNSVIILSGVTFILFFLEYFLLFRRNTGNRYIALAGTFFGLLGGLSLIGVALFPIDINPEAHRLCAKWTFRLFFPCTFLYAIALYRSKRFHNSMAFGYFAWSLFVVAYVILSELGPMMFAKTDNALIFQVVSQKIVVFTFIINVLYQTFHLQSFFELEKIMMIPNKRQSLFSSPYFSLIKMPQLSVYVFICFNILAMGLYAGGTYFDIAQPSYSITNNFFSDLGRWMSYSGRLNVVSFVLFNSCVIFAGLVFTLFYINFQTLFIKDKLNNILAKLGTAFGILGSLCLIGVGLTPADLLHNAHDFCATWTFRLFFPCTLFYAVALFRSVHLKSSMAYSYLSWSLLVITYVLVSELGPSATSSTGALIFQVVAQKLIVLTYVLNVFFQTYHIKKMFVDIKISLNTTPSSLSETFLNQLKLYSEKIIFTKSKQ